MNRQPLNKVAGRGVFFKTGQVFVILLFIKRQEMRTKISIALTCILLTASIANTYAANNDDKRPVKERVAAMTTEEKTARAEEIRLRVEEIKSMDKSAMTREEKKALKKELKEMRREAKEIDGVYLSVGAIIIIILLLILIL